jgi:hypothetical protein
MITRNKYMLIYGGKNDQAFSHVTEQQSNILEQTCLNDICLFNFETFEWSTVNQTGFQPVGRWNAALAYSEDT